MSLKTRLIAAGCAALGVTGLMASGAGAVTHIDVRPYLGGTVGIGTTVPGDPNSVLCLVFQDGGSPAYNGKVNGVVVPSRSGELDVQLKAQDLITAVPSCVSTAISVDTVDATNIAIQNAAPKTGGTLQISTSASVQPGISATATTQIRVNYAAGQIVKLPSGGTLIGGSAQGATPCSPLAQPPATPVPCNPASLGTAGGPAGFADISLKAFATITKASLNLAACADNQYLIDSNTLDGSKSNEPKATKINLASPSSTTPKLGDAGVYVATIRDCAENTATVPGKAATTKIAITGPGAANVQFLKSSTDNPSVWDTTRGVCGIAKTPGSFPTTGSSTAVTESRVLICKGDYGTPIPLSLVVRNWLASGAGFKDSYGISHPGAPVTILSNTFS